MIDRLEKNVDHIGITCHLSEAVFQRFSAKKAFLEISQNSQEKTCTRVSFLIELQSSACNFIKKVTLAEVFPCEFCEISKNIFFYRTPPVAASPLIQVGPQSNSNIWDKVFNNRPGKICGRQSLKKLKGYGREGSLLRILLGPFLNTFSHLSLLKFPPRIRICLF